MPYVNVEVQEYRDTKPLEEMGIGPDDCKRYLIKYAGTEYQIIGVVDDKVWMVSMDNQRLYRDDVESVKRHVSCLAHIVNPIVKEATIQGKVRSWQKAGDNKIRVGIEYDSSNFPEALDSIKMMYDKETMVTANIKKSP
jgi:hypothetical protein